MRASILVISLGLLSFTRCQSTDREAFLDKFRYGIELVHRLFSNEYPSHFGNFFAGVFKTKQGENFAENLFNALIRTIGGNEEQIGFAGIRMSVLVAKMISDAFPQTSRSGRSTNEEYSPLDTILRQLQVRNLITDLQDPNLTDRVLNELRIEEDAECVKLLICKLSPFVRGMQRSLKFFVGGNGTMEGEIWSKSKPLERMYLFLPEMNEFLENGDVCDERHSSCVY